MNQIWPLVVAVMTANILCGIFFVGCYRASRTTKLDRGSLLCVLVPLLVLGVGFALYADPKSTRGWSIQRISE